jgi:pyruvate,orthophosphate dikinase
MEQTREALPRHVRHRVHRRARQVVDAADARRQAHSRGGLPDRHAHGRRGPDRARRGLSGSPASSWPADVPALRRQRERTSRQGHERLARRRRRQGRLRLRDGRRQGRGGDDVILVRKETNPDDLPGMVAARRHPDQPRRQDLARRRRRPRHGAYVRRRRRVARRRRPRAARLHVARRHRQRGRRHLDRRHDRRGVPRRGARRRLPRRAYFEGEDVDDPTGDLGRRRDRDSVTASCRRRRVAAARPRQRRHRRGRQPAPAASAPRASACAAPSTCSSASVANSSRPDRRRDDRRSSRPRSTSCCRCSARTSSRSSRRWTVCPVTIRLIDPPLHEFLPDLTELSVKVALAEAKGSARPARAQLLTAVRRLHEANPMLGLRGVRLGIRSPACSRCRPARS